MSARFALGFMVSGMGFGSLGACGFGGLGLFFGFRALFRV